MTCMTSESLLMSLSWPFTNSTLVKAQRCSIKLSLRAFDKHFRWILITIVDCKNCTGKCAWGRQVEALPPPPKKKRKCRTEKENLLKKVQILFIGVQQRKTHIMVMPSKHQHDLKIGSRLKIDSFYCATSSHGKTVQALLQSCQWFLPSESVVHYVTSYIKY